MIKPVNGHLIVEPLEHKTFFGGDKATYDEVGKVISLPPKKITSWFEGVPIYTTEVGVEIGDKVYFDSWLAAKFPTGEDDKYFWLVKWEDVRAIEHDEIPK